MLAREGPSAFYLGATPAAASIMLESTVLLALDRHWKRALNRAAGRESDADLAAYEVAQAEKALRTKPVVPTKATWAGVETVGEAMEARAEGSNLRPGSAGVALWRGHGGGHGHPDLPAGGGQGTAAKPGGNPGGRRGVRSSRNGGSAVAFVHLLNKPHAAYAPPMRRLQSRVQLH